jgi:hypothetical protein
MVAYCKDCKRYINQYCEICAGNFGVETCERFGCGGKMLCPNCGGSNLTNKRESVDNSYDFKKERDRLYTGKRKAASEIEARYFAERKMKEDTTQPISTSAPQQHSKHCPLCGYSLMTEWKFCPECGVSLIKK